MPSELSCPPFLSFPHPPISVPLISLQPPWRSPANLCLDSAPTPHAPLHNFVYRGDSQRGLPAFAHHFQGLHLSVFMLTPVTSDLISLILLLVVHPPGNEQSEGKCCIPGPTQQPWAFGSSRNIS